MRTPQPIPILVGQRVVLGITGSIAAYKAADLASRLTQAGADVDTILSEGAQQFISALTLQSLTGRKAYTDEDLWSSEAHILHVGLAEQASLFVIAPITANTMAKIAYGLADSLLTITALSANCPILLAPAMDANMYENAATQTNVATLRGRGFIFAGPSEGRMASGMVGLGRMLEPDEIIGHIRLTLARNGPLFGKRVLVSAGGTREQIDAVRAITNRSSGKQGYALAQAALDRGAHVTLVSAPTSLDPPLGAEFVPVTSANEMKEAILTHLSETDVLLMAAAVADFRPAKAHSEKLKRRSGIPEIKLETTDDILRAVGERRGKDGWPKVMIGFAAESNDLVANAKAKLEEKGLALIVANDISAADAGFDHDANRVALLDGDGEVEELPLMSKTEVAEAVFNRVVQLLDTVEG